MTCPTCGVELTLGGERCPGCGAVVAPRLEGALAPAPREVTPLPRGKVEPLRDIPALRKRERTWRDEVQERIRSRRQKRADSGLPLFDQPEMGASAEGPRATPEGGRTPAEPLPPTHVRAAPEEQEPRIAPPAGTGLSSAEIGETELADLPLRAEADSERDFGFVDETAARMGRRRALPSLELEEEALVPEAEEPEMELAPHPAENAPVERPAFVGERAQAAAVDAGLLAALFVLVIYFAGRAARANPLALAAAWPWIAGYLGLLGLFYATYFTGTTGQTPGKILTGLRVVDVGGRPPGYFRAMARAVAGAFGLAIAGLGFLPMVFDPARRAMHDRLSHTRVVRG